MFNLNKFPKGVVFLGLTSFLTDVAGESIYSVLPIFLTTQIGTSPLFIGILEGMAESLASILKFFSGYFSDKWRNRESLALTGYAISGLVRPLMGIVATPLHVFFVRLSDRVGKGIRGAPRDALLAKMSTPETRGQNFGFHKAMDHAGAIVGPLIASAFLFIFPGQYRTFFLSTIVIGILAFFFAFRASKITQEIKEDFKGSKKASLKDITSEWKSFPIKFKHYLLVLMIFTLGNSSDAFLLLKFKDIGLDPAYIPILWSANHVIKTFTAIWGGKVSDKIGRMNAIILGWSLFAVVYLIMATSDNILFCIIAFLAYGLFYSLTESPESAMVADLIEPSQRGTAYGALNLILGICTLPASLIFGAIATKYGAHSAFLFGAVLSIASMVLLKTLIFQDSKQH